MHQQDPSYLYNPLYTTYISVKYVLFSLYIGYFINISHINIKYYMKLYKPKYGKTHSRNLVRLCSTPCF